MVFQMSKPTKISSVDLAWIFKEKLKEFDDCNPRLAIAIVASTDGWKALTNKVTRGRYPQTARRVEQVQKQLREICVLTSE